MLKGICPISTLFFKNILPNMKICMLDLNMYILGVDYHASLPLAMTQYQLQLVYDVLVLAHFQSCSLNCHFPCDVYFSSSSIVRLLQ